ncbi:MAG: DNA polymerase III subunit gamma/tau [Bacilli bacterium]|nr:DNA polymerase III subunit gamma/tau [Bacilli bacterium]
MYQTLYRKYRPKTFDEVVGQDIIIKTIKNAIKNNKINHAYIFSGPRGTGKTSTAKIIAKTINCLNLKNMIPCNDCVNCTQINNKQSIDIIEIDAASNNGVDEIRELRNNVNLVPATGKYKIYIIDEVHMLTIGAFNALLKTLEEPPAHVIFILATTEIYKIPNTILSRCQKFDFKKISVSKIKERIKYIVEKEKINIEEEAITEISRLADGGMRDALSILDQVIAYEDNIITINSVHEINGTIPQYELKELIEQIKNKEYNQIFSIIDKYDDNGKNFVKLSEEIINFYRNILLALNAKEYLRQNISSYEIYEEISKQITEEEIIKNIEYFNNGILEMKKSNNPKLIFEIIIIKILNKEKNNNDEKIEQKSTNKQKQVEQKKEKFNNIKVENINPEIIKNIENIRINNTLCNFNKKQLIEFKNKIDEIRIMLMEPKYSEITSLILEGTIKAVGNNNVIIIYDDSRLSNIFNSKIIEIDQLFKEVFNEPYKLISTDINNWNIIKDEFNNKKKVYEYIEEPNIENMLSLDNNLENEFSDILQYD